MAEELKDFTTYFFLNSNIIYQIMKSEIKILNTTFSFDNFDSTSDVCALVIRIFDLRA